MEKYVYLQSINNGEIRLSTNRNIGEIRLSTK